MKGPILILCFCSVVFLLLYGKFGDLASQSQYETLLGRISWPDLGANIDTPSFHTTRKPRRNRKLIVPPDSDNDYTELDVFPFDRTPIGRPKIIFWGSRVFSEKMPVNFQQSCPEMKYRCIFHSDQSLIADADAVIFHEADTPLQKAKLLQIPRKPHQRFIWYTLESPANTHRPLDNYPAHFFNWTMTYLPEADVYYPYDAAWITKKVAERKNVPFNPPVIPDKEISKNRSLQIIGMISNNVHMRLKFITDLHKKVNVALLGAAAFEEKWRNICPRSEGNACIKKLVEDSYFFIALENSICTWYTTEKYFGRAAWNSVPIVWARESGGNKKTHTMGNRGKTQECALCKRLLADDGAFKTYESPISWYSEHSACSSEVPDRFLQN
ncbi:unnamed protein product, partial [Mesorhabditis spiculigera]